MAATEGIETIFLTTHNWESPHDSSNRWGTNWNSTPAIIQVS